MSTTVRELLLILTIGAVCAAAIAAPGSYWPAVVTNLNVGTLLAALIGAIYCRGASRAFSVGYLIGDGFFFLVEFFPLEKGLVNHLLHYALFAPPSKASLESAHWGISYTGMMITGFVYGYAGAVLARGLWRRAA